MHLRKTDGVVLHRTDFKESDLIITLYTADLGKVSGIAKGAKRSKRRFVNNLQPFSYIRIVYSEGRGGLIRLDEADMIQPFFRISEDISKVLYGSYFLEMVKEMTGEKESNLQLFELLVTFLSLLNDSPLREEYPRIFELRFLDLLGYRPRLTECSICNQILPPDNDAWFSYRHGGAVCKRCQVNARGAIAISGETLRAMERALGMDLAEAEEIRFTPLVLAEGKDIFPRFVQYQLGKGLKSLRVMEAVQGA
ncbi:MAG: DNA repair protein RecO [Deltaproteobacteria bacterium]|nr:DNA repair protein RecO [Deltaproteobacteria bacterium]